METGASSFDAALVAAHAALDAATSGATASRVCADPTHVVAPDAPRPLITAVTHTPSQAEWTATVNDMLNGLSRAAEAVAVPVPGPAAMEALARLAASNGGEVAQQVLAQQDAGRTGGAGNATRAGAALADLARTPGGRAALQELAGRGGGETQAEEWWDKARNADVAALEAARPGPLGTEQAADVDPVPIEVLTGGVVPEEEEVLVATAGPGDGEAQNGDNGAALPLTKVVLARRSDLALSASVDPLALLATLHGRSRGAYAFALKPPGERSGTFVCCTPERLFALDGGRIATEAVAGTRPRGADERLDAALSYDMLTCPKEHAEFTIVQEWVRSALRGVCSPGTVVLEAEKQVLRTDRLQHLYSRLAGTLTPGATEADVLAAMHPTPAVCGAPRALAQAAIAQAEAFDRGLYAGPVGWLGASGAEFAVAIRSALAHCADAQQHPSVSSTTQLSLYAGVGVVRGASAAAEWQELSYKVSQYEALLTLPPPLADAPNINAVWAQLVVEECVRCGVRLFCIAPGSRSTPLALAASRHPRVRHVICIDERSLAFHALGASKAGCLAAVITSSGTAVANLLPATVEACEAEVPLLLLTADRPPEMRACGSNQTIDQVDIFGKFTRWATEVGPPEAGGAPGAARQLLTTIDNAVFRATSAPAGPVHINCAFREPLAPSPAPWSADVLSGLDRWWSSSGASFTSYAQPPGDPGAHELDPLVQLVNSARRGLIVAGHLERAEDVCTVSLLATTLGWPLVADVTSGLRVGPVQASTLVPHFDLALMERESWPALAPDVILQFGGRLTSKRLQSFLEQCALDSGAAWAFVARHPWRQDPGHAVRLRLQAAPASVAASLLAGASQRGGGEHGQSQGEYTHTLATLDGCLRRAVDEHLGDADSLTEMAVARQLSRSLPPGHALYLGNSMPVRDMDVYADVPAAASGEAAAPVKTPAPGVPVACNRGASGIDGVVSSAIGFAAGLASPATLLIGDVSFAHDSNGLLLLRERAGQPPVTVVVINNGGGAIFNFLPVAGTLDVAEFGALFTTPPDVRLADLCRAHRVHHLQARTPRGLAAALADAWRLGKHAVVEVVLRDDNQSAKNLAQHRAAEAVARATTRHVLGAMAAAPVLRAAGETRPLVVVASDVGPYSLELRRPLTTSLGQGGHREGALLRVRLACGATGMGDVAPLPGLHKETLTQAVAQAATLAEVLAQSRVALCPSMALLNGGIAHWLRHTLGVNPDALLTSVRFGLESALLAAVATACGQSMTELLTGSVTPRVVAVNALLPAQEAGGDSIEQLAQHAVGGGFTCLKIKVARPDSTPAADAARVAAVRAAVGPGVALRVDANRGWSLEEAIEFGDALNASGVVLEYLEEPTQRPEDIPAFAAATGIPVALDESVDEGPAGFAAAGARRAVTPGLTLPAGTVALVLKPGSLGGLEKTAALVRWAHRRRVATTISSAFESSVGLASLAAVAAASDQVTGRHGTAHGLGTSEWFKNDVATDGVFPGGVKPTVDAQYAARLVSQVDDKMRWLLPEAKPCAQVTREVEVVNVGRFTLRLTAVGGLAEDVVKPHSKLSAPTAVFLHGFMGSSADWLPVMKGVAAATNGCCVAIDLPGHGGSRAEAGADQSLPGVAAAIHQLLSSQGWMDGLAPPMLIGYSMGARVALHMALHSPHTASVSIRRLVCVSGTAGVRGAEARAARASRDDALASALRAGGVAAFSAAWYKQKLFSSLAQKPGFGELEAVRCSDREAGPLAQALAAMSPGRAPDMWPDLQGFSARRRGDATSPALRVDFVVGSVDSKFVAAARKMAATAGPGVASSVVEVPLCGHAVHMEAPEALVVRIVDALRDAD